MANTVRSRRALFALLALAPFSAFAQTAAFNLPSQPLAESLKALGALTNVNVMVSPALVDGRTAPALQGEVTTKEALAKLLEGTGLEYVFVNEQTVVIREQSAANKAPARTGSQAPDAENVQKPSSRDGFRVAQADQGVAGKPSPVEKNDSSGQDKVSLQEVVVMPEILIKGSHVFNVDVKRTEDDAQPYHILDSKQIQESGAVNVEDFLKRGLPMNTAAQAPSQGVAERGASSVINLRGLGANETLVLIDGRRSAAVTLFGRTSQPDLNAIPLSAIERIEVLPSSASAIYGGAAMGGVVNVILKKNYDGGQISYSHEDTFEGHAPIDTVSATYGMTLEGGKTRVMLSGQYSDATPLRLRNRPEIIAQGYDAILARDPTFFSSSPARPYLGATPNIGSADGHTGLTFKGSGTALGSPIATIAPGASAANPSTVIPGRWNSVPAPTAQFYGVQELLEVAPTVKSLMASLHRDFGSHLGVFAEFSTGSNSTTSPHNPLSGSFTVPASSPTNPFNQDVAISIPSSANTPFLTDSVTRSVTVGMLARLPADWNSELDYTWSKSAFSLTETSYFDTTAFKSALGNGTINPFLDTLAHPLDLTSYIPTATTDGASTVNDLGLRVSGPIGSLPAGRPTLTIGLEHRKEGTTDAPVNRTYPLTPSQDVHQIYFGQSQSTNSVYAEAQVPLVAASNAVPLVHSVELQLAGRSERYTVNARTPFVNLGPDGSVLSSSPPQGLFREIKYTSTNPTIGLKYKPIEDLTFRASYARAFLPPIAQEFLPTPGGATTATVVDPVNGQPYTVLLTRGGNPDLRPQTSRDWNFGVILEPRAEVLKGLRLNVEYYRVTQLDYITTPSPQEVLGSPAYANRVTRDPTTHVVTGIDLAYLNATQFSTAGWDLIIDYDKPTAIGTFGLHASGSAIDYDKRQYTISGALLDYAGFTNDDGEAKLKGNATLSWSYRTWTLAWTATYFGNYKQAWAPGSPNFLQFGPNPRWINAQGGYSIPSQTYNDILVSYDVGKMPLSFVSGLKIELGVKNLFNKIPPQDAFNSPGFYSPYGDARLRDYWLRVSARF